MEVRTLRYFLLIIAAACSFAILTYGPVGSSGLGGRLEAAEAANRDTEAAGISELSAGFALCAAMTFVPAQTGVRSAARLWQANP